MNHSLGFPIIFFIILVGCGTDKSPKEDQNPSSTQQSIAQKPSEDELIMRLSPDLIANPQTQAEKDQNAIINYAIDHLMEIQSTRSGLYYQVINPGEGDLIKWGDLIKAHYRGKFLDGKEFDSSYRKNKPIEFYVGNMIDGWNEGLQLVSPGGKILLLVPSGLAYGEEGLKDSNGKIIVLPYEVLIFEIEVLAS